MSPEGLLRVEGDGSACPMKLHFTRLNVEGRVSVRVLPGRSPMPIGPRVCAREIIATDSIISIRDDRTRERSYTAVSSIISSVTCFDARRSLEG